MTVSTDSIELDFFPAVWKQMSEDFVILPRIMLADDHTILLEAFCKLLEPLFEIVGTVSDGRALLESAPNLKPDAIVVDVGMPLLNGLEAGLRLKEMMPSVKIIFLTMNDDPDLAVDAMRSGASGYLLKSSAAAELIHAIRLSLKGKSYVTPKIARGMEKAFINNPSPKGRGCLSQISGHGGAESPINCGTGSVRDQIANSGDVSLGRLSIESRFLRGFVDFRKSSDLIPRDEQWAHSADQWGGPHFFWLRGQTFSCVIHGQRLIE